MGVLDDYREISTMTDGTMTPDAIELALAKLAPDAIGLLEGVLRGTKRPNKHGRVKS
jgi:hypothetical protein